MPQQRGENSSNRRTNNKARNGQNRPHKPNRGGRNNNERKRPVGPQRPGYREERIKARSNEPDLPADIDIKDLDREVLDELKSLAKDNREQVAKHLIMAATWLADDPKLALRHARAAKDRAGRVGVVRETAGIVAYHAGEWKEALSELRTARRISGGPGLLAVMADCERGLGKPEKAVAIWDEPEAAHLDWESKVELAIVVAGAWLDLGNPEAAQLVIEQLDLNPERFQDFEHARLYYMYAEVLLAQGDTQGAATWFGHAAASDPEQVLDAPERREELQKEL